MKPCQPTILFILTVAALTIGLPLPADTMFCFTETWHFVAYDDDGSIIDEWDETYTDCFTIGIGDGGGSGNGGGGNGGGGGGSGERCEGLSRHISVVVGQFPVLLRPRDFTLRVQKIQDPNSSVDLQEGVDLAQLGMDYAGFRHLFQKRRNNLLLIDRGPLRGGMLVADVDGNGKPDRAGDFFLSQVDGEGLPSANAALTLAKHDHPALGGNDDGFISPEDHIWQQLMLWFDDDGNGTPSASELYSLLEMGFEEIRPFPRKRNQVVYHSPMEIDLVDAVGESTKAIID